MLTEARPKSRKTQVVPSSKPGVLESSNTLPLCLGCEARRMASVPAWTRYMDLHVGMGR